MSSATCWSRAERAGDDSARMRHRSCSRRISLDASLQALRHDGRARRSREFDGTALEGLKLQHPFQDRQVPVILGEHVTLEAGTGAVHTAPGHGQEDFAVGKRYDLPVVEPGRQRRPLPAGHAARRRA